MEYKGKIYGKVGKSYFPLEATTDDCEALEKRVKELQKECDELHNLNAKRRWHFDCWDRLGRLKLKSITADSEDDAILLFKSKFPDMGFDEPYNL